MRAHSTSAIQQKRCPLCAATGHAYYAEPARRVPSSTLARRYFRCPDCSLVFLDPAQRLSLGEQRSRYERHRNDPGDDGYVRHLRELVDPLTERLAPGARGLDYGCGPAPVLASIVEAAGYSCTSYDPLFAPDPDVLDRRYSFVTCCEVIEHVHDPARTFSTFANLLADGGLLGVMTRFIEPAVSFGEWWYRRDITHVCFHSEWTMRWVAARHDWMVEFPRRNVAVFTVPPSAAGGAIGRQPTPRPCDVRR